MAEVSDPTHYLEICSQKFSEFLFNAEHKCLLWLREIEEEAMKMFDNNFSAEPQLIPKMPSQKKYRRKKRSSSFKDDNKELTRKRLSRRQSSIKPASFQRLSQSKGMKKPAMEVASSTADCKARLFDSESSRIQCDKTAVHSAAGEASGIDCSQNFELTGKTGEGVSSVPEMFTVASGGLFVDRSEAVDVANSSGPVLPNVLDLTATGKDWGALTSISVPKASLNVKPECQWDESSALKLDDSLMREEEPFKNVKDSTGTSASSRSGCRPSNRLHKKRRVSVVEKYSLTNKRKSAIRKSISRAIAKNKAAQDSSSASSQVSHRSFMEVFIDDEISNHGPSLNLDVETDETLNSLQKMTYALDVPSPVVSCAAESATQLKVENEEAFSKATIAIKSIDSKVSRPGESASNSHLYEELQTVRCNDKQALDELPAAQHAKEETPSPPSCQTTSLPAGKIQSPFGTAKITRPLKNFFQTMQKNQLLKSPKSLGQNSVMKTLIKHSTPARTDPKEKERQRLESLRKKQEAELLRKQKVEEEKRKRLEEVKVKREERLRKALQARERVEQMEEEKKKRMEQKLSRQEEKSGRVREERMAEEKTKRKTSIKKMGEAEAQKQKSLQEDDQEHPEKWKTVGEIKKMLEHSSAEQVKGRHHEHQEKEKWVTPLELPVVTEEEENLKEQKIPAQLEQPQQVKKVKQTEVTPAINKWRNITAQKSIGISKQMSPQALKDSCKINLNDYGMDLNSDDSTDDESQPRKPIPPWANGLQLNDAVTHQYYNPPDISKFFGQILSPKLEDIFYKSKPRYFKRTSSAVWNSPPSLGIRTALRTSNSMKKY